MPSPTPAALPQLQQQPLLMQTPHLVELAPCADLGDHVVRLLKAIDGSKGLGASRLDGSILRQEDSLVHSCTQAGNRLGQDTSLGTAAVCCVCPEGLWASPGRVSPWLWTGDQCTDRCTLPLSCLAPRRSSPVRHGS